MNDLLTMNSRHTYWRHLNCCCCLYMTSKSFPNSKPLASTRESVHLMMRNSPTSISSYTWIDA